MGTSTAGLQGWPPASEADFANSRPSGAAGAVGAGFGGSTFMIPGSKKVAGETLWVALMPPHPATSIVPVTAAAQPSQRTQRFIRLQGRDEPSPCNGLFPTPKPGVGTGFAPKACGTLDPPIVGSKTQPTAPQPYDRSEIDHLKTLDPPRAPTGEPKTPEIPKANRYSTQTPRKLQATRPVPTPPEPATLLAQRTPPERGKQFKDVPF